MAEVRSSFSIDIRSIWLEFPTGRRSLSSALAKGPSKFTGVG
jgi:hypothetical protein